MLLTTTIAYSQDIIVKRDGSTILSKVLEVGEEYIKYKKWSNLEGPDYTIKVSEILSINYENGDNDDFSPTDTPTENTTATNNFSSPLSNAVTTTTKNNTYTKEDMEKAISDAANKAANKTIAGRGLIIGGGIVTFFGLSSIVSGISAMVIIGDESGHTIGGAMIATGAALTGAGSGMIWAGRAKRETYAVNKIIEHEFEIGNYALTPSVDMYSNDKNEFYGIGAGLCFNF